MVLIIIIIKGEFIREAESLSSPAAHTHDKIYKNVVILGKGANCSRYMKKKFFVHYTQALKQNWGIYKYNCKLIAL